MNICQKLNIQDNVGADGKKCNLKATDFVPNILQFKSQFETGLINKPPL